MKTDLAEASRVANRVLDVSTLRPTKIAGERARHAQDAINRLFRYGTTLSKAAVKAVDDLDAVRVRLHVARSSVPETSDAYAGLTIAIANLDAVRLALATAEDK